MPRGNDFTEINPAETVTLTWDFGGQLSPGVTVGNPVTACSVIAGVDSGAAGRLIGNPVVGPSPTKGTSSQAILQQASTMVGGVMYLLSAIVNTSDNQTLEIYAHAQCQTPA